MKHKKLNLCNSIVFTGILFMILQINQANTVFASGCPAMTVANEQGIKGRFLQQFELSEFEKLTNCKLSFSENPEIAQLNALIGGNPKLKQIQDRLPNEPLVWMPYHEIGKYGGTFYGLSNSTESGTSDLLSMRHVHFARYSDNLKSVVPNVAKSLTFNDDYTILTIKLRKGHRWSDGAPFTSEDVLFWYYDVTLNKEIYPKTSDRWLFNGKPILMKAADATTVVMRFPVPAPGIINRFAVNYQQPFLPKHFYGKFHIKYNSKANELAKEKGLKNWVELFNKYYRASDWKDVPSPLLDGFDSVVAPTLESHILVKETSKGRVLVANPYYHIVDTAGNQLPYISKIDERYVPDKEVRNLKITNGEVTYKQQSIFLSDYPLYKENEKNGNYQVDIVPAVGENVFYSFNVNHKDPKLRAVFADLRFRQAMSIALDRNEINELVYLGTGKPEQSVPAYPSTVSFVTKEHLNSFIQYNPKLANKLLDEMGLVDKNEDGLRDFPDGSPLVIRLQYANLCGPVKTHELAAGYWRNVGIRVDLKEVSTDEYRSMGNNNEADITTYLNNWTAGPSISENTQMFYPPFGYPMNPGTGYLWAIWMDTEGKKGLEPPADVKKLYALSDQWLQLPVDTPESNAIGKEIVDIHVRNLWKIGIIGEVKSPVIHHNTLGNFPKFTAVGTDYFRAYPFRSPQWYIKH
jgi:peptide/nickel transport system substrate-binding protein